MVLLKILRILPKKFILPRNCAQIHTRSGQFRSSETTSTPITEHSNHDEEEYENDIKKKILAASLPFVPEHGWTKDAIGAGAESLGYSSAIRGMFDNTGIALVHFFQTSCNHKLCEQLKIRKQDGLVESDNFLEARFCVENRLRMLIPMLPRWTEAMALSASPQNVTESLKLLFQLSDDICYHIGGTEVDMTWYKHRSAVSGLYVAGELYLIQDTSPDYVNTWKFLDRGIGDLREAKVWTDQISVTADRFAEGSVAAITTIRNILGFGSYNR